MKPDNQLFMIAVKLAATVVGVALLIELGKALFG
jgi:hypothetical protein